MVYIKACCCWESLHKGSKASAVLTFVVGVINVIIDIYLLTLTHSLDGSLEWHEKYTWLPPGIIVFLYVMLAFNIALIFLAFVLNIGINRGMDGKGFIRAWTISIYITRIYELALGIYVIAWLGGFRIPEVAYMAPELNAIIAYWILSNILFLAALICVRSYWRELLDEVYGKERRTKYFSMLSNIRTANRDRTGTATPLSYWSRSRIGSRVPSHTSLAPSSHTYGNPAFSHHPSQSSYGQPQPQPQHHQSVSSYHSAAGAYVPQHRPQQHQQPHPQHQQQHPQHQQQHPQQYHPQTQPHHPQYHQPHPQGRY